MDRAHFGGAASLILVTALWGSTFVAIKIAVGSAAPCLIILIRFAIAALVFLPWLPRRVDIWWSGLKLGFWLGAGYATQTIGLQYTTASQSAFITVLNVIIVPILAALGGRRIGLPIWAAAVMAVLGVGLLTNDTTAPNVGDAWTLLCALTYAFYVLQLGRDAQRFPVLPLTAAQLFGVTLFGSVWTLWQQPVLSGLPWGELLYLGLATTALTTWLQTLGQRRIGAPEAAVIYALEPVWAAVFAFFILSERLGSRGLVGAGCICVAILVAEWRLFLPGRARRKQRTVAPGEPEASAGASLDDK